MKINIEKSIELGKIYIYRFNLEKAAEEFSRAQEAEPDNQTILGWLAITYALMGKLDDAQDMINRVNESTPVEILLAKGIIQMNSVGLKQGAIKLFTEAIRIDPENDFAYALRGIANAENNLKEAAIFDLEIATEMNPSSYNFTILGNVKMIYFNDSQGALVAYNKAIELDRENPEAWIRRGDLQDRIGSDQSALADYTKAIQIDPDNKNTWLKRGCTFEKLADAQGALSDFTKALELDPDYVQAWYKRGRIKRLLINDNESAVSDLNKSIQLDPRYAAAWDERGDLNVTLGNWQRALEDYSKALQLDPGNAWTWAKRGYVFEEMSLPERAMSDFNKAVDIKPDYADVLLSRAYLKLYLFKDAEGALADFNRVLVLDPGNKGVLAQRGSLLLDKGETKKALRDLNEALVIDKDFTYALDVRAELWQSLGKYELAVADNAKAYELAGIPKLRTDGLIAQEGFTIVYSHFQEKIKNEVELKGEKFLGFWECYLYWSEEWLHSMYKGKQSHAHFGKFGIGFICLTDRYLRIKSLGVLSCKYGKELGVGFDKSALFSTLKKYDFRTIEENDKIWAIPFNDLRGIYKESNGFRLVTLSESWQIYILTADQDYVLNVLELARAGNLNKLIFVDSLKNNSETTKSKEDIFEEIERLVSLREKGIITKEEFEHKKKSILQDFD